MDYDGFSQFIEGTAITKYTMEILLAILPKNANSIFSGIKKYEFRRVSLNSSPRIRRVFLYAAEPVNMIVGEITKYNVFEMEKEWMWGFTEEGFTQFPNGRKQWAAGITKKEFDQYFKGKENAWAIEIEGYKKYDTPISLESKGIKRPPKNFMYLRGGRGLGRTYDTGGL